MTSERKGTTKSGGQKHQLDKFYTKPTIAKWCIDKIDLNFHLEEEYPLPKNSFLLNDEPVDVPCVFQI